MIESKVKLNFWAKIMKLFSKYTGLVYLKYFIIIFMALELFYIGIDTLTNLKDFPKSANLQLIYLSLLPLYLQHLSG